MVRTGRHRVELKWHKGGDGRESGRSRVQRPLTSSEEPGTLDCCRRNNTVTSVEIHFTFPNESVSSQRGANAVDKQLAKVLRQRQRGPFVPQNEQAAESLEGTEIQTHDDATRTRARWATFSVRAATSSRHITEAGLRGGGGERVGTLQSRPTEARQRRRYGSACMQARRHHSGSSLKNRKQCALKLLHTNSTTRNKRF